MTKKKLLLSKEAAAILRISVEYLRSLIRRREIIAYKEGRRGGYRIPASEIESYIDRKKESLKRS
jgi:excisionase family DNA binding protein